MEREDLVVEVLGRAGCLGDAVEVADVLPGLLDDLGAVVATGSLVPGDHRPRVEGLDRVQRGDPVAPSLRVGLGEVEVNVVVGGVAGDDEADVGDVQAARLVGVGVAEFDHDEFVALEVDRVAFEWLREYEARGSLPSKRGVQNDSKNSGVDPARICSMAAGSANARASGKRSRTAPSPNQ